MTEPRGEEEPVPGPSGLGQRKGLAAPREEPRSPSPDGEGDSWMEPEPRGPPTKGAQRRALLADTLLRRGASFRHIRQLSLPWQGVQEGCDRGSPRGASRKKGERTRNPERCRGGTHSGGNGRDPSGEGEGRSLETKR